jgi:Tfp pilus assembly protein PilV
MIMNFTRPGFSLIEIVVVLFLVVVIVPAINNIIAQSVRAMAHTQREVEALYLAQEGMEVVRAYRDSNWQNFVGKEGTNYINNITNAIDISSTPALIDEKYTREVIISDVCRDASGDIVECPSVTEDNKTKKVDVAVSWEDVIGENEILLSTYLTAFRGTGE